jgi:hypothetical protein
VEKLHQTKSEHELWVTETLGQPTNLHKLAEDTAVTALIDSAVELCHLERWKTWTSKALSPDPHWHLDLPDEIDEFRQRVVATIWPATHDELRRAAATLSVLLLRAATKFLEHARPASNVWIPNKFYKALRFNPNYDRDLERYQDWVRGCHKLIIESSRAANWFADVVRRDVNPMFFIEKGRFLVVQVTADWDLNDQIGLLEFTSQEKARLPGALFDEEAAHSEADGS